MVSNGPVGMERGEGRGGVVRITVLYALAVFVEAQSSFSPRDHACHAGRA